MPNRILLLPLTGPGTRERVDDDTRLDPEDQYKIIIHNNDITTNIQ